MNVSGCFFTTTSTNTSRSGSIYKSFSLNVTYETERRHQVKQILNARQLFRQIVSVLGGCVSKRTCVVRLKMSTEGDQQNNTLGNFLPNFGHEKCPRLPSPLLWNSAWPYCQPAKSENRSGFIAIWESTVTNKQCFDERGKSCEERAFYRYLACLVFENFETSFMSAKKEFLAGFLREYIYLVNF